MKRPMPEAIGLFYVNMPSVLADEFLAHCAKFPDDCTDLGFIRVCLICELVRRINDEGFQAARAYELLGNGVTLDVAEWLGCRVRNFA